MIKKDEVKIHKIVEKKLLEYSALKTTVRFPGTEDALSALDYEEYLLQLQTLITQDNRRLDSLIVTPCVISSLEGLIAFSKKSGPIQLDTLVIELGDVPELEQEQFVEQLQTLLLTMSEQELKKLTIKDEKGVIKEDQWKTICTLVKECDITIDLLLPEPFQTTEIQRDIDRAVSTNIRKHQLELLGKTSQKQVETLKDSDSKKKRTRPRINAALNLNVEIELQQEQQIEVTVETSKLKEEIQDVSEEGDLDVLSAAHLDKFLKRINTGEFNIPLDKYLLSEKEAIKTWNNWFGHVDEDKNQYLDNNLNKYLYGISSEACEQLLQFQEQLQLGLDLNHLPQGFILVKYPKNSGRKVLHYDRIAALLQTKKDPLAPVLKTLREAQALSFPLIEEGLKQFGKGSARDRLIAKQWNVLQKTPYDREALTIFQHHLSKMLAFDEEQLTRLFALAFDGDQLNKEQLDLLMNHLPKFSALFPEGFDEKIQPAGKILLELFGKEKMDEVLKLANSPKKVPDPSADLLSIVLAENKDLQNKINEWQKIIPNFNRDAFLQVYNQRGDKGVEHLFALWGKIDAEVLMVLHESLFKNARTYMPLLELQYQEAIQAVEGFNGEKKSWWEALLKKQGGALGYDDLPALIGAFKKFSEQIEARKLSFYSLDKDCFADVKNMPVALARMLTILDNCPPDDLEVQWKNISHISLDTTGALRAITDARVNGGTCSIVLPEMNVNHTRYANGMYQCSSSQPYKATGYQGPEHWKSIVHDPKTTNQPSLEEIKEDFYRIVAHQTLRLPISFYQEAFQALEQTKFRPVLKARLAALLVASTTGAGNLVLLGGKEKSLEQWNNILKTVKDAKLPSVLGYEPHMKLMMQEGIVEDIYNILAPPPALPIFNKLLLFTVNSLKTSMSLLNPIGFMSQLMKQMKDFGNFFDNLNRVSCYYKYYVYQGMQFYGEGDYKSSAKDSVFHTWMDVVLLIVHYPKTDFSNTTIVETDEKKFLISLVSTFQIRKEDVVAIQESLEQINLQCGVGEVSEYVLKLLGQMERNVSDKGTKLTSKHLIDLLNKIPGEYYKEKILNNKTSKSFVEQFLEEQMSGYYGDDFFKTLQLNELPKEITQIIDDNQSLTVEEKKRIVSILNQFPGESPNYKNLLKRLTVITDSMPDNERNSFLTQLERQELYQSSKKGERLTLDEFNNLLTAIMDRGHVRDFMYLMAQKESVQAEGLVQKVSLYLNTIVPGIEKNKSDVFSKMDAMALFSQLLLSSSVDSLTDPEMKSTYCDLVQDIYKTVSKIMEQSPGTNDLLIDFVTNYMKGHDKKKGTLIVDTLNCVHLLQKELGNVNNSDVIRSLCYHYSGMEGDFTPQALLDLLEDSNYKKLGNEQKKLILTMVSVLLNNEKHFKAGEIRAIMALCNEEKNGKKFLTRLQEFYTHPPYPALSQIKKWQAKASLAEDFNESLTESYRSFNIKPCERELGGPPKGGNGFSFKEAKEKLTQSAGKRQEDVFQGVSYSDGELQHLEKETIRVRDKSTRELLEELSGFKSRTGLTTAEYATLVALNAELLYRSKGNEGPKGSSFEIHTTQYLAILATLTTGTHNTSEIGTGEGKSRIMAIGNACQFALGKTVDFITSDVQLATRDYLEFQAYFTMLGAETNLIHADTPADQYRKGGINYSDASNLSLFRNKARSAGQGKNVIDSDPAKRALMLDEADKTYFDSAETSYNYSAAGDEALKEMEWIYPVLMDFFAQDDVNKNTRIMDLYYADMDGCNDRFQKFTASKCSGEQLAKLKGISKAQLESWQESAVTARQLQLGKHFGLEFNTTISTPYGPEIASVATLIADNRESKTSKFSAGVHQCLHARLNRLWENPEQAQKSDEAILKRFVQQQTQDKKDHQVTQPFNIDTEKQIIYSSNSKNLLDDYNEGTLIAVTGTAGSIIEQEEAKGFYGEKTGSQMKFISVPRHTGLKREDKCVRLTANSKEHINALVEYIQESRRRNQPILILCEDDKASEQMHKALEQALVAKLPSGEMQRIHSQFTGKQEKAAIKKAGQSCMVTVSTGMIGRGVDIKLEGPAKENGLAVLVAYLPRDRDFKQMIGRSGRAGNKGDSRLVLDKQELKKRLGKTSLNDGFYTAPETWLRREQAVMDRKKQCERLIKHSANDFSKQLTDLYFKEFLAHVDKSQHKSLYPPWMKFTKDRTLLWNEVWQNIISEMDKVNPDSTQINAHLSRYREKTQTLWNELYREISELTVRGVNESIKDPVSFLRKEPDTLQLDAKVLALIKHFDVKTSVKHQVILREKYDPAHDGLAVIYSNPFEKLRATLFLERKLFADFRAWRNGHGILFPNLRAWWNGYLSIGQLILGFGIRPSEKTMSVDKNIVKEDVTINNSYQGVTSGLGGRGEQSTEELSEDVKIFRTGSEKNSVKNLEENKEDQKNIKIG